MPAEDAPSLNSCSLTSSKEWILSVCTNLKKERPLSSKVNGFACEDS